MSRYTDDHIDALKQNTSLLNWAEMQGHVLKKEGADYVMRCVFHKDKTASLKITPRKNLYHCFGCGAAGSIIDWVMQTQHMDFRAAVKTIDDKQLITKPPSTPLKPILKATSTSISKSDAALTHADQAPTIINNSLEHYHHRLKHSPQALAYLANRGLNNDDLINTFKLGYSDKTLSSTLAAKHTQSGQEQRQALRDCGVLKPSGYEHFAGCLIIPIIEQPHCVGIYGRKIQPHAKPKHLYLPGPHRGVWNSAYLHNQAPLIVCEALIDAMTFWVNGFKNVTASYGTSGFTKAHLKLIEDKAIKQILIAYDRDDSGERAAFALAHTLKPLGIACYRIHFPKNMDVNSYAQQVTPAKKSLALVIKQTEPMLQAPTLNQAENISSLAAKISEQNRELTDQQENKDKTTTSPLIINNSDIILNCGSRHYRVKGLSNNTRLDQLKINLLTRDSHNTDSHYVDHLDLYHAKARQHYISSAAEELVIEPNIIKKDLGQLLLALEDHQQQLSEAKDNNKTPSQLKPSDLNEEQIKNGLELLNDKNLMTRIINDINTLGITGEDSNVLVSYLACVSRKLEKPLAIMIQSSSAAGKSALMDSVLSLMPETDQHKFAAMTGQSLYYMGALDLKHHILAISEEEGAQSASYALKLLQSEGEVSIASTAKNEQTGDLETKTYQVEGPVMLMMTTTAINIDEELMNRCLVLSVNESRAQTQAIHALQRQKRTLAGLTQSVKKQHIIDQHHHAQTLIKKIAVINPYAEHLTFLSDKTRTRRDHEKYLTLIDSITLLHQYQRETKHLQEGDQCIDYIEVTLDDIEMANQLAHDVLGKSLDELPPQTRKLLNLISEYVTQESNSQKISRSDYRFSRKDIREATGWSDGQLKIHCHRLEEMEYLLIHSGSRGHRISYELLYSQTEANNKTLMGLIDVTSLKQNKVPEKAQNLTSEKQKAGAKMTKTAPSQPQDRVLSGLSQSDKKSAKPSTAKKKANKSANNRQTPIKGINNQQTRATSQASL